MQGDNAHHVLSADSLAGILTCVFVRGAAGGLDVAASLLSEGALSSEIALGGNLSLFSSPRKAVRALADLVASRPNQLSGGLTTGEVETELNRLRLMDEAQGIASLSEPGQVLISLGTVELVRQRLDGDESFVDLGTRPISNSGPPTRVFSLVMPGLAATRSPEAPRRPWYGHRFIGRITEIERIGDALAQFRLVTLAGPTGIGKTALASRVELEIQDQFSGGSYWVDLKLVTRSVLLVHRLAQALEIHSTQERTLLDQVVRKLGEADVLLILDGVDALHEAVADLCEHLLRECPNASILVTGNRRLNSSTELSLMIEGMQRPSPGEPLEAVREYDSIRVFVEEALLADPAFTLTSANAEAVCSIAEIVDGSPWALKMAASRLSVLSSQQLLARLRDDPFRLLHEKDRGLELAMRTSLGVLSPWAQVLFRRLSVFSGPFAAEAVEEVCAYDQNLPRSAVLAALRELFEVHLIQPFHSPRPSKAFFLSRLAADLASRLARESSETGELARSQSKYLSTKIQQAIADISTGRAEALAEFDLLYEDVRGSWLKRLQSKGGGEVAKAVVGIYPYWFQRGYYAEALDIASRIFETRGAERSPDFVRVLLLATWACNRITDYEQAKIYARLAVRTVAQSGPCANLARALNGAGSLAIELNRPRTAQRLLRMASELAHDHLDATTERLVRLNLASAMLVCGDLREAEEILMVLAESSQRLGWADLTLRLNIADLKLQQRQIPECWHWLLSACDQFEETPDPNLLCNLYATATWAAAECERYAEARCLYQAHDAIIAFYGLSLSPRKSERKRMIGMRLQGKRGSKDAWDPSEPVKLLKSTAIRFT
jgi:predicted ATPase